MVGFKSVLCHEIFCVAYSERYINRIIATGINEQEERATGRAGEAAAGDF